MTARPSSPRPCMTNPEPRSVFAGARGRAVAATVAAVMGVTLPIPAMAAGPADIDTNYNGPADINTNYQDGSVTSARALTQQGQAAFDSGDYMGAASAWKKILDILPENELNREERENALLISLEAYKQAFRRVTLEGTSNGGDLLREALKLCDAYTKEVGRVHGPTGVSPAVVESRVEIEGMLANAGDDPGPRPPIITNNNNSTGIVLEPDVGYGNGKNGTGLIVGGSVAIVAGLGMMPLIIIGARNSKQADEDIRQAMSDDDMVAQSDAEAQKRSANAMIISGSILMGVLTVGGATMLGIGIRRRIRYTAVAPTFGPSYVGLSLQRRF